MEIVTIEKRTFELWKQRFENFVRSEERRVGKE